jgi:hypothetical protein
MFIIAEFLMACGIVAVVGSLIYTGYKMGKADKGQDKDE